MDLDNEALLYMGFSKEELLQSDVEEQNIDSEVFREKNFIKEITDYWSNKAIEVKESAVGEDFQFFEYLKKGYGQSVINLASQFHAGKGVDFEGALRPHNEDTGWIERFIQNITTGVTDTPVFIAGALPSALISRGNKFSTGFGAGFLTEGLRKTYIDALQNDEVNNFTDFWESFTSEGWKEGVKGGLVFGTAAQLPASLGFKSLTSQLATQFAVFSGLGPALEGRFPTKEELVDNALMIGALGYGGNKAANMINNLAAKKGQSITDTNTEVIRNPKKLEDVASENLIDFRDQPTAIEKPPKTNETETPIEPTKPVKPDEQIANEIYEPIKTDNESLKIVENQISNKPEKTPFMDSLRTGYAKAVTNFVDGLHPVYAAVKAAEKNGFKEGLTVYERFRKLVGDVGKSKYFLEYGALDFKTLKQNGESLRNILGKYTTKNIKELDSYLTAKRSVELSNRNIETGIPIKDANNVVKSLEKKYEKDAQRLLNFQDKLLQYMVDAELIAPETVKTFKSLNKDYVPFYRVLQEGGQNVGMSKLLSNPIKKIKGSDKKIISPLESIYKNTITHIQLAERNLAYRKLIELAEKNPEIFPEIQKVKAKTKQIKVTKDELKKMIDPKDKIEITDSIADGMTLYRKDKLDVTQSQIALFRNGKREVWEVGADLAAAVRQTDKASLNVLLKILGTPARLVRAGSTLAPDFVAKNVLRDTLSAAIFSKESFVPFYHTILGTVSRLTGDKVYQDFVKSGGMQSMLVSFDRKYFQTGLKKELQSGKLLNQISNPLELLRALSENIEVASRLGNFKLTQSRLKREGRLTDRDILEKAGFEARDITVDFGKVGSSMSSLNAVTSFFNARIQGYAKIVQAFKENPVKTSISISSYIVLPSVLLWMRNHDDPRYQEIPEWQKDTNWIFIVGDGTLENGEYTVYRFPKPFELGILFGTGTEKFLDYAFSQKSKEFTKFMKDFATDQITNLGPIPDILKPGLELWGNRSFFTGRAIVQRNKEKFLDEYEYTEYTSETAKFLAKWLDETTNGAFKSPAVVDHIIKSWTSTLGAYGLSASDYILKEAGIAKKRIEPEKTLSDLPVIKAFVVRFPTSGAESIAKFYEEYKKISEQVNSLREFEKRGDIEEVEIILQEKIDFDLYPLLNYKTVLDDKQNFIRQVYRNDEFSAAEKRQLIDDTYRAMIVLARDSLELIKTYKD